MSSNASAREAWVSCTSPSRPNPCDARLHSSSSSSAWTRIRVIARFEAERQALAMMEHPNIANVLDAGATDGGRPYFVMELVRGVPITEYCDQAKLTTEGRLKLFTSVCLAIQHAHMKGRDPSRPETVQRDGHPPRWRARGEGHRLRHRQGHGPRAHRADSVHGIPACPRNPGVHGPRAGGDVRARHRYPGGRLLAWGVALRTAHRYASVRAEIAAGPWTVRDAPRDPGGGSHSGPPRGSAPRAIESKRSRSTDVRLPERSADCSPATWIGSP